MKKLIKFYIFFVALLVGQVHAYKQKKSYGDLKVGKLERVYDGDTFKVTIPELHPLIGKNISVRIKGVDTPERKSGNALEKEHALQAMAFTKGVLEAAQVIILRNVGRDKYFRILADVDVDGKSLAALLIENGFALPYDGGTKMHWGDFLASNGIKESLSAQREDEPEEVLEAEA